MIDYGEPVILETQGTVRNNDRAGVYRETRPMVNASIGGWFYEMPNLSGLLLFCQALVRLAEFFRRHNNTLHLTRQNRCIRLERY